ncbi:uncharacterized protein E0L32_001724 [Thyridium curvatum]|uniref:Heterokaryon incompatibility domain-containing protein n=1 Tax=Thyridium curvatum TaxID=1093900 RepID=A0A507AGS3_9PEZI|nr:uncharacterized protein E0L32_001475 [Thyridium curvatum]XP_030990975.1 uncharacterized protein E0L32_001724 [Thyridium curvatum]TPX09015.1 hypothetical protein E0L32_001475 [Thyridium curvatum]TPX09264.1 hypothetical protein E0L32_001724 [Thyridium curvatum]
MDPCQAASSIYGALDDGRSEIRALSLNSGDFDDPISCSLQVVSLQDQPIYRALSYVWGTAPPNITISINGHETQITPSLAATLRRIRHPASSSATADGSLIWIDAICINQADLAERGSQVKLMGRIYRQASRVLIWLGEGTEHSDWALDRLNDASVRSSLVTLKTESRQPTLEEIRIKIIIDRDLEMRSYWTRTWVVQEMALAQNDPVVHCGGKCVPLSVYVDSRNNLPFDATAVPGMISEWRRLELEVPRHSDAIKGRVGVSFFHDFARTTYRDFGEIPMGWALNATSGLSATDARDRVYGVLGLLPPSQASRIEVNYKQHYMRTAQDAMTVVLTCPDPDALDSFTTFSFHRPVDEYPSWVPDLALREYEHWTSTKGLKHARHAWRFPQKAATAVSGDVLRLNVVRLDTVEKVLDISFNHGWGTEFRAGSGPGMVDTELLKTAEAMADEGAQRAITHDKRIGALSQARHKEPIWLSMCSWRDLDGRGMAYSGQSRNDMWLPEIPRERGTLWNILLGRQDIPVDWLASCPEGLRSDTPKLMAAVLSPLLHAIRSRCNERRAFLTEAGFFGVGSGHMEVGDVVAFVAGTFYAWILRPHRDGYRMVGFAYASGLMDWEILDEGMERGTLQEETVRIY